MALQRSTKFETSEPGFLDGWVVLGGAGESLFVEA
jgi:hypothetical protein